MPLNHTKLHLLFYANHEYGKGIEKLVADPDGLDGAAKYLNVKRFETRFAQVPGRRELLRLPRQTPETARVLCTSLLHHTLGPAEPRHGIQRLLRTISSRVGRLKHGGAAAPASAPTAAMNAGEAWRRGELRSVADGALVRGSLITYKTTGYLNFVAMPVHPAPSAQVKFGFLTSEQRFRGDRTVAEAQFRTEYCFRAYFPEGIKLVPTSTSPTAGGALQGFVKESLLRDFLETLESRDPRPIVEFDPDPDSMELGHLAAQWEHVLLV